MNSSINRCTILQHGDLEEISSDAERLLMRAHTVCDDYGRIYSNPKLLCKLLPSSFGLDRTCEIIAELEQFPSLLKRYTVGGKDYFLLPLTYTKGSFAEMGFDRDYVMTALQPHPVFGIVEAPVVGCHFKQCISRKEAYNEGGAEVAELIRITSVPGYKPVRDHKISPTPEISRVTPGLPQGDSGAPPVSISPPPSQALASAPPPPPSPTPQTEKTTEIETQQEQEGLRKRIPGGEAGAEGAVAVLEKPVVAAPPRVPNEADVGRATVSIRAAFGLEKYKGFPVSDADLDQMARRLLVLAPSTTQALKCVSGFKSFNKSLPPDKGFGNPVQDWNLFVGKRENGPDGWGAIRAQGGFNLPEAREGGRQVEIRCDNGLDLKGRQTWSVKYTDGTSELVTEGEPAEVLREASSG